MEQTATPPSQLQQQQLQQHYLHNNNNNNTTYTTPPHIPLGAKTEGELSISLELYRPGT